MEWLLGLAVLAALVIVALFALKNTSANRSHLYEAIGELLTPAERSFYGVMTMALSDKAVVLAKVRVADVLKPARGLDPSRRQSAFNKISSKHFDFVICAPDTMSVMSVIELDDKSHNKSNRRQRDAFVEAACEAAGVTLHRFKAAASYNAAELRGVILETPAESTSGADAPEKKEAPLEPPGASPDSESATCPKCASKLVLRVAKKGKHKGTEFMACSAYPNCRHIQRIN